MKTSDELHQLIHSLSQSEKWHFRVYAGRQASGKEKNYLKLFDAIAAQQEYDEAAICARFEGEHFVKQLSALKNYLYKLLLESLSQQHARNSTQEQVRHLLHCMELLYAKGLYAQVRKLLRRARKLAAPYEMPLEQLRFAQWELSMVNSNTPLSRQESKFDTLGEAEDRLAEHYRHHRAYLRLIGKWSWLVNRYGMPRSKKDMRRFESLYRHPLMQDGDLALTVSARSRFFLLRSYYHTMTGELKEAQHYNREILRLYDAFPQKLGKDRAMVVANLSLHLFDYIAAAIQLRHFDKDFDRYWAKLRAMTLEGDEPEAQTENIQARLFIYYYYLYYQRELALQHYEVDEALLQQVMKGIERHRRQALTVMENDIYLGIGLLYFYGGHYAAALPWFNKILNDPRAADRLDIYGWVKICCLIIHYELDNERVLEYSLKSTQYYLLHTERLNRSEKLLLQFFEKELPGIHDQRSMRTAFKRLHRQLLPLREDPFERRTLLQFDLAAWLQSRIEGRPLPEVMKAQLKK